MSINHDQWFEKMNKIQNVIISYDNDEIALTKSQVKAMFVLWNELHKKCPHAKKVHEHKVLSFEDEFGRYFDEPRCNLKCFFCNEVLQSGNLVNYEDVYCLVDKKSMRIKNQFIVSLDTGDRLQFNDKTKSYEPLQPKPPKMSKVEPKEDSYDLFMKSIGAL